MNNLQERVLEMARGFKKVTFALDMYEIKYLAKVFPASFRGEPIPPRDKTHFRGTSRKYRAARRQYGREMRAHKKGKK